MAAKTGKSRTLRPGMRIMMAAGMLLLAILLLYPGKKAPTQTAVAPTPTEETQAAPDTPAPNEETQAVPDTPAPTEEAAAASPAKNFLIFIKITILSVQVNSAPSAEFYPSLPDAIILNQNRSDFNRSNTQTSPCVIMQYTQNLFNIVVYLQQFCDIEEYETTAQARTFALSD